jgi:hypothetical protein
MDWGYYTYVDNSFDVNIGAIKQLVLITHMACLHAARLAVADFGHLNASLSSATRDQIPVQQPLRRRF